ncbi:MAG TPA: LysE family translocator [Gaiellaceae bacterium]|nr:LysE family translocator [Gaiellaceae bacterium]
MIGFLAVAAVVIVAPGPDFALTLKNTVRGGGVATAFGVVTGQVVWVVAAAAGVAALLAASHPAFVALRLVGAAYLVWLGLATLLARGGHTPRHGVGSPYRQGLLSNLANPKMPVFFISLLPQFGSSFVALTAHGLVFVGLTFCWLTVVSRGAGMLLVPRVRRIADVVTGVVLVALGLRLAIERR